MDKEITNGFLLQQLEFIHKDICKCQDLIGELREEVSALKVKAGIWGIVGGGIPILLLLAIYVILSYFGISI